MTRDGFTLIELLVVVLLVGILASIGSRSYTDLVDRANDSRAMAEIRNLQIVVATAEAKNGRLPETLAEAGVGGVRDPWGNPYVYTPLAGQSKGVARKDRFLVPLNSDFDLYSKGKDGRSQSALTAAASRDDILRANDGAFIGRGEDY